LTATTVIVIGILVSLFFILALGLAWAQQHARQLTTAPAEVPRRKRRPF